VAYELREIKVIYLAKEKKSHKAKGTVSDIYHNAKYAICNRYGKQHLFTPDEEVTLWIVNGKAEYAECPIDRGRLSFIFSEEEKCKYDLTPLEDSMLPADEPDRSFAETAMKGLVFLILCFFIGILVGILIKLWNTL
jgi:hypothetical protein